MALKVCFDMTAMLTISRFRGIGRNYSLQLARSFGRAGHLLDGIDLHLLLPNVMLRVAPYRSDLLTPEGAGTPETPLRAGLYRGMKHTLGVARLELAAVDLFHSPEPKGTSRPPRSKIVVTCHDLIPFVRGFPDHAPWIPRTLLRTAERLRYKAIDHFIAISQWSKSDLQRLTGLGDDRATVVYQGVDRDLYGPDPASDDRERVEAVVPDGRPYFLYIGGFDSRKRVPDMVEAFGRCANLEERLVICGRMNDQERREIVERAQRTGSRDRIVMPGFVEDASLPALYRGATAHVMLSRYEGFGATLVEAMACGCPVVAARASCVPETTQDAAHLIDGESIEAISEALTAVASDARLRESLAARGVQRAAYFSWDRCAKETIAVYRRVLGE